MKKQEKGYMGSAKVGAKGQIVIPKEVREMFDIAPGDSLIILADEEKGIAIQKLSVFSKIADLLFRGKGKEIYPDMDEKHLEDFAYKIKSIERNIDDDSNKD